ncbi:SDR family NAD(P)-dependent oxidoreductase [Haloactinomyces albus]|uniref:Short-subunit dehydrogenase n=1 Tax=Haloactinomyces albus TaxID=1352928 RepID=A0AAE3Z853_9ACTN|nr:SDR family NAD(P)-dependent oxidoreductase [Haloactinomyces albus]MDR7300093.1 short-subunit dehydrogenase [Haloactinomyces albus]
MADTKRLAVITGASSGIGYELARQFAQNGFDVLINAEETGLDGAAEKLRETGAEVTPVQADLTDYNGVEKLYAAIGATGRPVDAAALNAGVGQGGSFVNNDLSDELTVLNLNVTSTVHLAKRLLVDMVARNEGKMLFTSSIASMMPGSYQAVYNASKSFVQSFAEAVADELKETRVTITSLEPGPTDTNFFRRGRLESTRIGRGPKDDPAQVAQQGFEALMAGRQKIVAGSGMTKAMGAANSMLPDKIKAAAHNLMSKPRSGQ